MSHHSLVNASISSMDQPSLINSAYCANSSNFDCISDNRLYTKIDGSIALQEKPLGVIVGEQLASVGRQLANFVSYVYEETDKGLSAFDKKLTFPMAEAKEGESPASKLEQAKKAANRAKGAAKTVRNPGGFYNNMVVPELKAKADDGMKKLEEMKKEHDRKVKEFQRRPKKRGTSRK